MADEILDALMDVFNSANYRFLSPAEVTQQLQLRGFYQNVELHKAMVDVWNHLCYNRTAAYPFWDIERSGETLWGLEWWLPKRRRHVRGRVQAVEPLRVGWEIQHTLSSSGFEIESRTFPLRGQNSSRLIASMDEQQREHPIVEMRCYGSEKLICAMIHDERDNWVLEGMALQHWYKENGVQPGDKIWLAIESINPVVLRIYTEWDRDADTYRRYEQRRNLETLPSTDLPIRDLIWLHFNRTQKVSHRSEIAKVILADRPEISEHSVGACLSANPHLFVRIGEGNWGLKEWGIEQVTMVVRPHGSDLGTTTYEDFPSKPVPLDYVLVNIAAEDLVYKILQGAKTPLSDSQITERISKYLGVDRNILARTSFLNLEDSRLVRLHDGTIAIRENLEEVIGELTAKEKELKQSLDRAIAEAGGLKDEMASAVARYETRLKQLERERDEARHLAREWYERHVQLAKERSEERAQLSRALSKFLVAINPYVGRPTLQLIFNRLRRKPEPPRAEEEAQ